MASVCRFVDNDGNVLVDFEGVDFYQGSPWGTRMALPGEITVPETLELLSITDRDGIRRDVNYLMQVLKNASRYQADPLTDDWVWFEAVGDGEGTKRALVYGGTIALPSPNRRLGGPLLRTPKGQPIIAFDRHRYFESDTADTVSAAGYGYGMKIVLSGEGTAPARIGYLEISHSTTDFGNWWVGIRPTRYGTDDFDPVMDLTDGTLESSASSVEDTDAVGGYAVEVDFSSLNNNEKRVSISINDHAPLTDRTHFIGRYLVLLRYEVTGASTVIKVRMRHGVNLANYDGVVSEPVYISSASGTPANDYFMVPLGVVSIPFINSRSYLTGLQLGSHEIALEAEMLAGTPGTDVLRLNTLTLVPADRLLVLSGAQVTEQRVYTHPNDELFAYSQAAFIAGQVDAAAQNFNVPREGGVMVVAGGDPVEGQDKDQGIGVDIEIWRRWDLFNRQVSPDV